MIFLIYRAGWQGDRAHIARATTLDDVLFGGDYRCLCGTTASGKRNWSVVQASRPPDGTRWCEKCREKWERGG